MTVNLKNLDRWSHLEPDMGLVLDGDKSRRIRLHVNSPGAARFYLVEGKKERFLATVHGCDVLEFVASGTVEIATKDADVWCHTAEHEPTFTKVLDPVIFTRIMNRRQRNPELEQMMFLLNQNMEKRLAQQQSEHNAALAAFRKETKASTQKEEAGVHVGAAAEPPKSDEAEVPDGEGESVAGPREPVDRVRAENPAETGGDGE